MPKNWDSRPRFSIREGYEELPQQFKIGMISDEFRRLVHYAFSNVIRKRKYGTKFDDSTEPLFRDFHVVFLEQSPREFDYHRSYWSSEIESLVEKLKHQYLFDIIEFFVRHKHCPEELRDEIKVAFEHSNVSYRLIDGDTVVGIGSKEQADAYISALQVTKASEFFGARMHLKESGRYITSADWASSIRESIHAVESVACRLEPSEGTLGGALNVIEKNGKLHRALKSAFSSLYGFASDEDGVRHALVFGDKADVDETDALFMLGACASFVSYLIARSQQTPSSS